MDEQPDEAGVRVVVRFVVFLAGCCSVGKGGRRWPDRAGSAVHRTGRGLWGDFGGPLFPLGNFCDRFLSLFESHGNLLCCAMLLHGMLWCDVSRCKKKKKKRYVALTLEVTHDGDDDEGVS